MLSKKRDFVKEIKNEMEMFRDMAAKWMEFQNIKDERGMDGVSYGVWLGPLYIKLSM